MAASLVHRGCARLMSGLISSGSACRPSGAKGLHVTAVCCKNRAARVRVEKGNKPVTYEEAHPPHYIGHRKGWLSQHTSNLKGEEGAADRTMEDVFIRRFIAGTFHSCLATDIVIKRRGNMIIICAIMLQRVRATTYYFLTGYSEYLLSHFYKCPVKIDIQVVADRAVYKYI